MRRLHLRMLFLLALAPSVLFAAIAHADEQAFAALDDEYRASVLPLVAKFCVECHSGDDAEGELNLEPFKSLGEIRPQANAWVKVAEMLKTGDMPPKDAEQPTADERGRLRDWLNRYLTLEARSRAGDPGRVVLRRLNNAEYTYTLRDLTGVESLAPAREFPVDGAAGEGFTNTGGALAMSPSLVTKYLDAGKRVAEHAVLLPDGIRFSPHTTRRDWTDDALAEIRAFYRQFTDARGGTTVNLQGVVNETNQGGRLPVQAYLAATLSERDALRAGKKTIEAVAKEQKLNAKYLGLLWQALDGNENSKPLQGPLDALRIRWRDAKPADAGALAADVAAWQEALFSFSTVGHIGIPGGPTRWLQPKNPLVTRQELRFKLPAAGNSTNTAPIAVALVATDAGDGSDGDVIVWERPRLVAPGRPDILLRDVRALSRNVNERRRQMFAGAARALAAADESLALQDAALEEKASVDALAKQHGVEASVLQAWFDYLGIAVEGSASGPVKIENLLTDKLVKGAGHDFINGWGKNETPSVIANSSDQMVRIPGDVRPHSVVVHPSPELRIAIGWRSPVAAKVQIESIVKHAHPGCGNGVTWSLELRRGAMRQRLAGGPLNLAAEAKTGPLDAIAVRPGDVISVHVGPRDGNHACDLTAVDLKLTEVDGERRVWNLADDLSGDILAGNPHADRLGHRDVWHFYTEADKAGAQGRPAIPPGSMLAKWQTAKSAEERRALAESLQKLLLAGPTANEAAPNQADGNPADVDPDTLLYRELASLHGPLLAGALREPKLASPAKAPEGETAWGLDPALFGKIPVGVAGEGAIDAESMAVRAPSAVAFQLPADLAEGCELVVSGVLAPQVGAEGSVQLRVAPGTGEAELAARGVGIASPILVGEASAARKRIDAGFEAFRQLFPAALCYTTIVPVDEVVTLTLFHREDDQLCRLMLDDAQVARLNRLWDELHFVSQDPLLHVDVLAQLYEYATQDRKDLAVELDKLREPFAQRAAKFRTLQVASEPAQLSAVLTLAEQAYRRPLTLAEREELQALYRRLRSEELPHEAAIRLTLARVFVAPAFLYRIEKPGPGAKAAPVDHWELASRLSYFLWSSAPDDELRRAAAAGGLTDPETLVGQMRRMLADEKARRWATEFACQWLHIYEFDQHDEKSERHFPTFAALRGPMHEESVRFFTDLVQRNGSVLEILDANYTFVNDELAKHYEIPNVTGPEWRRVDGLKDLGRGGILAQASTLSKQSGASRTSPILRGNWISEVLLGERLPRPPNDVPQLPDDETATAELTVRQLVEKHSSDARCAVCHKRIDPMGFSLEGFDAIGRRREKDLGDRPIEVRATTLDGAELDGLDGLRKYLLTARQDDFLRQFCRKLLGYSLGRAVQLSDEPLLAEMQAALKGNDYKIHIAFEAIVRSPQFREIRGRDAANDE